MQMKCQQNNWIRQTQPSQSDSYHENLMLRVLSQFRKGVEAYNKSSITGSIRKPSQKRHSHSKLPEISIKSLNATSKLPKQMNQTLVIASDATKTPKIDNTKQYQVFRRKQTVMDEISTEAQAPEFMLRTIQRATTAQSNKRSSMLQEKKNWYRKKYGAVEMKGVVFRKKVITTSLNK